LAEESAFMKVSLKLKVFCYAGINLGILITSVGKLLDGASVQGSLIVYLASAASMNLLLWIMFRMKDKSGA
jgi:hypothetical protein